MSTKSEAIARELISRYKADKPTAGYVQCELNQETDYLLLAAEARKRRSKLRVVNIQPVNSDTILSMWVDINPEHIKGKYFRFDKQPQLGVFKIHFSDDTFLYCARYFHGQGRNSVVHQITAAERPVWRNWLRLVHSEQKRRASVPAEVSSVKLNHYGVLEYSKIKRVATFPAIHPELEALKADISFFFDHVAQFTRYNQPGVRKALLVGPPGTGKTSMCLQLAREFRAMMPIVFSTDVAACAAHLALAAKQGKATLTVLEDADSSLDEASSDVLNFLDGVNQPANPKGSFVLMTTNFPERIEPRILQRPGRIDRLYQVGELRGTYATQCAQLYFPDDMQIDASVLSELVSGLTGAQIKELAQSCISYAVSSCQPLTPELIGQVKERIAEDLKQVYKYAEVQSPLVATRGIGFINVRERPKRKVPSIDDEELPLVYR